MSKSVTFDVSPELTQGELLPAISFPDRFASSLRSPIEAMSPIMARMIEVADDHALLSAAKFAFYGHFPLRLSPDVIWLTLARNFALHVLDNAEEFRGRFVQHHGKEKLSVERPDFLPGEDNPWEEVFESFSELVAKRVGKIRDWVRCDFSTTGPVERAVSDLMVMETFEPYFEYEAMAGCGIPKITLLGTPADWKSVRQRTGLLAEFGLTSWCNAIEPVLRQFEAASNGDFHQSFWQSIFRYHSGSGPAVLTGWLTCLFPYLQDDFKKRYPNPALGDWQKRLELDRSQHFTESWQNPQGVDLGAYPACLTNVPLTVSWGSTKCLMRIVGGLIGVSQDAADGTVEPVVGWALTHGSDRGEWKCTSQRTIWPMIYHIPNRDEFQSRIGENGETISEFTMPTTSLGDCTLLLRAKDPTNLDLPYSLLQDFCRRVFSDVAGWRDKILKALAETSSPELSSGIQGSELLVKPKLTATWIERRQPIVAEFRFALDAEGTLRVELEERRDESTWSVRSVKSDDSR